MSSISLIGLVKVIVPESKAQIRKIRKETKKEWKSMKIGLKKAEKAKIKKMNKNMRTPINQRAGKQIKQARLYNH